MMLRPKLFRVPAALTAALLLAFGPAAVAPASSAPSPQCRRQDTIVVKPLRFARGRTTAVIRDTIRVCFSHEYRLRARAGQTMSVNLATGRRTSLTVSAPTAGTLEGADGVKTWSGELPEDGEYSIQIGTDATAAYTLEVTIR